MSEMTSEMTNAPAVVDWRLRTSETMGEFAKALAEAQAKFDSPKRDKTATIVTKTKGTYTYTYADLASCLAAIRKPLSEVAIAIIQAPMIGEDEQQIIVTTRLIHSSGEWAESSLCARAASDKTQSIGSAITYMRRYALSAMTGIATEEDDDGAAAAAEKKEKRRDSRPAASKQNSKPAASKQSPEVEAAAAKLRGELLKRTTSKAAAVALLTSITKHGDQPGIGNVAAFKTIDDIDKAWVRLDEIAGASMMPQAKPVESEAPEAVATPEPHEEHDDSNLLS